MHYVEAKGILSNNNTMNVYRGCSHGCIYCDSRSKCYNYQYDFSDIEIKLNAPNLLQAKLQSKKSKAMIVTGSMTDPYIPLEETIQNTRKCLEIIEKEGFGVSIITKSSMILRDLELLKKINEKSKCVVQMTLTTFDEKLCTKLEPNVSTTSERFETLRVLYENNIPTIVWLSPILPYINDNEKNIKGILEYCLEAHVSGIVWYGATMTLREGNREYYYQMLDKYFPGLKEQYQKKYKNNYVLYSENNKKLDKLVRDFCTKNNIECDIEKIFNYIHEFPADKEDTQLALF